MPRDMGELGDYQRTKDEEKYYPWPCEPHPDRTIRIFGGEDDPDVLRRTSPGVFIKITGLCCANIQIPEEDIVEVSDSKAHLYMQ